MTQGTVQPSVGDLLAVSRQGNVIPVHKTVLGDLLTPAAAFLRVAQGRRRVFLLESVEGGERLARYSFIGFDPFVLIRGRGDTVTMEEMGERSDVNGRPLEVLRSFAARFKPVLLPDMPPFTGGAVGYFGYDLVRQFETLPCSAADDLRLDDFQLMYFSSVLAFDHLRHRIHIIANIVNTAGTRSLEARYQDALQRIEQIESRLTDPISMPVARPAAEQPQPVSNTSEADYKAKVLKAKQYIKAGDIFQVVLSQRLENRVHCDVFDIYRALRFVNPSPYMFFVRLDDLHLVGSSPEMLVKVRGRTVEYGPIAGTRPRGSTPEEDARLAAELREDSKEQAEHVMLVDLGRNDLGRVCEYGSVRVTDLMRVERYSHVMHLVSSIEGILREGSDCFDALQSCLPAGTVSGAPKVRAMEIIDELEGCRRGVYGGAVGYIDFSGNMDTCIALRTLVVKDGIAYVQAGGGVVADSVPELEWQESLNKAQALVRAIDFAHNGLR